MSGLWDMGVKGVSGMKTGGGCSMGRGGSMGSSRRLWARDLGVVVPLDPKH